MKRTQLAKYSAATVLLMFAIARCSPLAQSIPKVGGRQDDSTEEGSTLSLPSRPESSTVQHSAPPSTVSLESAWVDVSRYSESALVASIRSAVVELTQAQLDAWVLNREVVAFKLPAGERVARASVIFRLDLSQDQMRRAEIPRIQVALVPDPMQADHWILRIVTGKESAVLESFAHLERVSFRLVGPGEGAASDLHPSAPLPPVEETTSEE